MKIVKFFLLVLTTTGLMLVSNTALSRHAALLIDADSGNVLYELEANQSWYPASLTKLMTLYMTFSALESGRLRLKDTMDVSNHAAQQPTSKLGLRPWETISVEDAILAVVTRSANDAAVVLAEKIAGSETQFGIQMTSMAHNIGMYGSHFMNATGLPNDWQTTTAHDMALLALRIVRDFPQYYPYFGVDSFYINGRYLRSTNKFVAHYPGAEGMKTGYTCGSGFNLVATANQNGKRLIGVVLGGMSSSERYQHMFNMMDNGFADSYGAYSTNNINTMNKNSVGTPPYQLPCGHRPSTQYASKHIEENDEGGDDHHVRYVRKTLISRHHVAYVSRPENTRTVTKIRIAGRTKTIVKQAPESLHVAKAGKNSRSASKRVSTAHMASASSHGSKSVRGATAKTSKATKSGKPAQLAQAHSKGYYVPSGKSKKATAAPAKSKSPAKPVSASKTPAKGKSGKRVAKK